MQIDQNFLKLIKLIEFRRDYNQSNGGNISYKRDGKIYIKPSGVHIGHLKEESDFFIDDICKFNDFLSGYSANQDIDHYMDDFIKTSFGHLPKRPSIETVLHTQLKKYTVHIHSISSTILACQKDWKNIVHKNFEEVICLDYFHPGLELGLALKQEIQSKGEIPSIVFLQNHGIILTSDNAEDLYKNTIKVHQLTDKLIELKNYKELNKAMPLFEELYEYDSNLSLHATNINMTDEEIKTPFLTPDILIHCGAKLIELDSASNLKSEIEEYKKEYNRDPHLICFKNNLYIIANSRSKALEIEEVFQIQISLIRSIEREKLLYLNQEAIERIVHWSPGKWRRK